eukprot:PhF_6_TR37847/c0_g2_i1/m.56352
MNNNVFHTPLLVNMHRQYPRHQKPQSHLLKVLLPTFLHATVILHAGRNGINKIFHIVLQLISSNLILLFHPHPTTRYRAINRNMNSLMSRLYTSNISCSNNNITTVLVPPPRTS